MDREDLIESFDPEAAAQAAVLPSSEVLVKTIKEASELKNAISQMEEDIRAMRKLLHSLRTGRIPDLMAEAGISELTVDGISVKVGDLVSGSIPRDPEARQKAISLLEEYEADSIIKTSVSLEFTKSQHNEAISVAEDLRSKGYPVSVSSGVHPQTLCSFVRERIKSGEPVDADTLGVFIARIANFVDRG